MKVNENVYIDEYKSFDDWGLIFASKKISEPTPKIEQVEIPARNGVIDMTEAVTPVMKYENRKITLNFILECEYELIEQKRTLITSAIHGKNVKIFFDDDRAFYWYGRIEVKKFEPRKKMLNPPTDITLEASVYPFKMSVVSSVDDWLWDDFNFETGVINELNDIKVEEYTFREIAGSEFNTAPIFISDADLSVYVYEILENGELEFVEQFFIGEGSQVHYDWVFGKSFYKIEFIGNGTVSVVTRGGML